MSYQNVLNQVKKKQMAPVYLLYGTETYFIQDLKEKITETVVPEQDSENIIHYDLEETPIQEVVADAETYPLFSEQKLIIASNPVFLKAKPPKILFEHHVDVLYDYLNDPVPFTTLVFIAPYEKIDERKKISKALKKHATVAICQPLREKETARWINDYSAELAITIDPDVKEMLEAEFSGNLDILKNELHKYALYVGKGGFVSSDVANKLTSHSINHTSLRLADAVMEQDLSLAVNISKDLLKMKEEPIAIIGLLAFQFRAVLRVKLFRQSGYTQTQIQQQLKMHPFVVKMAMKRERRFSFHQLERVIGILTDADETMKRGRMEKDFAFELLIYDLIKTASSS